MSKPNRRDMILGSGILLLGLSQAGRSVAQEAAAQDGLKFLQQDPRNAEPALNKLIENWITPTDQFYIRSHAPNPKIDESKFRLVVEGMVERPLSLSMADIRGFTAQQVTATLTCAGNRRIEFNAEAKVGGVQWGSGAIGNANWKGASIADVLKKAGVQSAARHIWFEGLDQISKGEKTIPFGASIPIEKAMAAGEVGAMLAYEMNGQPLNADHGFPLRTVVPGYIGARSVKWVGKIVVSDRTSPNHYLATAYKIVKDTQPIDWQEAGPIYRYLINAAIGSHQAGAKLSAGSVELAGYVLPSGMLGARVAAVEVSVDDGATWQPATLTGKDHDFCWQLWKGNVKVTAETKQIILRAKDSRGNFMPTQVPWNKKGYLQNSWFRLPVTVS